MKPSSALRRFLAFPVMASLLVGCSRDPNVRKQKYFESGQRYFEKGKYREAAIQFSNALRVDPRNSEAHYKLAQSYLKMHDWSTAFEELDRTVRIQPQNKQAHIDMANLLIAGGEFKQAQHHIDIALASDPKDPQVHMAEANLKVSQNDLTGALKEMQKTIDLAPNRWDSYLNLGLLELRMNLPAAEANLKKAVSLNAQSTNAQLALGTFYQQHSRWAEAEQTFRHAIQLDPHSPDPCAALARLYMAQGKKAETEQLLKQTKSDLSDDSIGYRMLGDYYFAVADLDKAIEEYGALYHQHSSDMQVKKNYVQLLILKDRLDEATKLNDEILKANGTDSEARIYRGQIQIRRGHPSEAADILEQALEGDPDNAVAHYHLGVAFDQMGNLARAEGEWRAAVRRRPDLVEAQQALAAAELRKNDWEALAETAGQMIQVEPTVPDGYALFAISAINRHHEAKGEQYIRKVIQLAPTSPVGYIHMGNLRLRQKQYREAEKYYEQALDRDPNAADALGGIMNVSLAQKQPDKAAECARAQLRKEPNNSNFHYLLGSVLVNSKDWNGAQAELKRAVELDKNNLDAVLKLAQLQMAQGSTDQALVTYQGFLQRNPRDIRLYILMGEMFESQKVWDKAKDMYQKALEIQPDNPLASNNLSYMMLEHGGNLDVALSLAQAARRGMPDSPNAADTLGWVYYQKGAYSSAIGLFKEALRLNKDNPGDATFHYHLGLAYQKTDQAALARQQLERVLRINPTFSKADDVRKLLAQLR